MITCPACNKRITGPHKYCMNCGYAFTGSAVESLQRHFETIRELEEIKRLSSQMSKGISSMERRLSDADSSVNAELRESYKPPKPEPAPETVIQSVAAGESEMEEALDVFDETPATHETSTLQGSPSSATERASEPASSAPAAMAMPPRRPAQPKQAKPTEHEAAHTFELQMGMKWLLIAGIVTMVFGVGYFLKYSFEQGWVGPAGRVASAYLWGIAFLVGGDRFRARSYRFFGLVLAGGGIATLYFAAFAGFHLYGLIEQVPTLFIMMTVTALACAMAMRYDNIWLAILGLVGGYFTPLMLRTGVPNYPFHFIYLTILNSAMIVIAMRRHWKELGVLGLLGGFVMAAGAVEGNKNDLLMLCYTAVMAVSFMLAVYKKRWNEIGIMSFVATFILFYLWYQIHFRPELFITACVFLNLFYLLYCLGPYIYSLDDERDEQVTVASQSLIGLSTLFAAGFNYDMITDLYSVQWVSLPFVAYAALFVYLTSRLYARQRADSAAFVIYIGYASALMVLAVAFLFSGHWITVFWAAEAVVMLWLGTRLDRKVLVWAAYFFLLLVSCKFVLYDYAEVFRLRSSFVYMNGYVWDLSGRIITTAVVLGASYLVARLIRREGLGELPSGGGLPVDYVYFYTLFGLLLFIVANIETAAFFGEYLRKARFAAISLVWTAFSVGLMVLGFRYRVHRLRMVSIWLFGFTLAKVFLVDISNVNTPYRIMSFIILGLMLIAMSYLYHRYKDRIQEALAAQENGRDE